MRVCLWHGWLLEGTGSNVYAAKVAEAMRDAGHDVLVVCQEPHPERLRFVDAVATVSARGVGRLAPGGAEPASGRVVVLRPDIGRLLPVFVTDEYEGFEVKRFVELTTEELEAYLERNAAALREAVAWHRSEAVIAGHAVPGPVVAHRALGPGTYVAKLHGSDLEYAVKLQPRYAELVRPALEDAVAVVGTSDDVLARMAGIVPAIAGRTVKIPAGVDVERFRPRPRRAALEEAAALLDADPDTARGRPDGFGAETARALLLRDADALDALARRYDQAVPDPGAARRLRALAAHEGPLVGYLGKLIPQKGVERLLETLAVTPPPVRGLVIGFGLFREWLQALAGALNAGDTDAAAWLGEASEMRLELGAREVREVAGAGDRIDFTGRLDHRYAPQALAALDVLVVPSTLAEAFGMVAAEAAAAGALPLVARHSGLAEVAEALEGAVDAPGLFSFEPGDGGTRRLAASLERLLGLPEEERARLRSAVAGFVASEWAWRHTAERLLEAAGAS